MAIVTQERMLVNNGRGPEHEVVTVYRFEDHYRPGTYGPPQRDLTTYEANQVADALGAVCRGTWNLVVQGATETVGWFKEHDVINEYVRFVDRLFGF